MLLTICKIKRNRIEKETNFHKAGLRFPTCKEEEILQNNISKMRKAPFLKEVNSGNQRRLEKYPTEEDKFINHVH